MNRTRTLRQSGQMAFGMMVALGLLAVAMIGVYKIWRYHNQQVVSEVYGATLSQYIVGVSGYVTAVQGGAAMPSNPYTVTDVNWLKPPACGGLPTNPVQGYVPCSFQGGVTGASYSTTITRTPATNLVEARTYFMVPGSVAGTRADAGSFAASVARNATAIKNLPSAGTFYAVFANGPQTANAPVAVGAITAATRGSVLAIVSNAPSQDPWLRVDGSNQMLANLNAGGHDIVNAKNGTFSGDMAIGGNLDATGDTHLASTLKVDGNSEFGQGVKVDGAGEVDGGLTVKSPNPAGQLALDVQGTAQADDVYLSSIGRYASQAIYDAHVLTGQNSYFVPFPTGCPANVPGGTPRIYTSLQSTGGTANHDAQYTSYINVSLAAGGWTVQPQVVATDFSLTANGASNTITLNKVTKPVSPVNQVIVVMTQCG